MKIHMLRALTLSLALMLLMTCSGMALTLRYPQRGGDVTALQTALQSLGYYSGNVDGIYGKGTRDAVKVFQADNGLSADGVAGPKTLSKLEVLTGIQIGGSAPEDDLPSTGSGLFGGVYTTIIFGMKGDRVRTLQNALSKLGYDVTVDGDFGSGTYMAVRAFQKAKGLTVDGKAGKITLQKLEACFDENGDVIGTPAVSAPPTENGYGIPTRTLRYGMSGEDVRYTQARLAVLGYYTGAQDGMFGTSMSAAVKSFQMMNALSADGIIGAQTRRALFSDSAIPAPTEPNNDPTPTPTPTPTSTPTQPPSNTPTASVTTGTLKLGDNGEDVARMQLRLQELGYYDGVIDGDFGQGTYKAVRLFQSRNRLTVDGKAGTRTLTRLYSDDAIPAEQKEEATLTPTPTPTPTVTPTPGPAATPSVTLRYGMTGSDVVLLQERLMALGYMKTATGIFDDATLEAVKAFQSRNNCDVDGVAGSQTYKKLYASSAVPAEPDPEDLLIPDRSLFQGDSGEDVRSVQNRLKALGYLAGEADGHYGSATAAAMEAFQQMNGLDATGTGNLVTYARLYSSDALTALGVKLGAADPGVTTLRSGATGPQVIRLQQALAKFDYDVTVNGTYDKQTGQAVRSFQALNGLTVDGVAGKNTQNKLYAGDCKRFPTGPEGAIYGSMGYVAAPAVSQLELLHWADELKTTLAHNAAFLCYDPATGISWSVTIIARGRHCDVEPSTARDTAAMHAAFGNKEDWGPKPVYVRLPDGRWTVATTHNVAHGVNPIPDNDFEGQNCVHFLRDMSEAEKNDPDYGVSNQKTLRKFWKDLTGQDIPYK